MMKDFHKNILVYPNNNIIESCLRSNIERILCLAARKICDILRTPFAGSFHYYCLLIRQETTRGPCDPSFWLHFTLPGYIDSTLVCSASLITRTLVLPHRTIKSYLADLKSWKNLKISMRNCHCQFKRFFLYLLRLKVLWDALE